MTDLTLRAQHRCFGGTTAYYAHPSRACRGEMRFAIYLPPQAQTQSVPVLYFLSGLTCTEDNFTVKAGAQQWASQLGLMLVIPDTSPRDTGIPDEDRDYDLGTGAGFYVDATEEAWAQHYKMYSYVTDELPALVAANFPASDRQSICGHSMGGHGALVCALRDPDRYRSVSAFAPISAPTQCAWGEKAFSAYLGSDRAGWRAYDASELVAMSAWDRPILVDQGDADDFLAKGLLLPEVFADACSAAGKSLTLRYQPGYDHGYFFIATFIEEHLRHHAAALQA